MNTHTPKPSRKPPAHYRPAPHAIGVLLTIALLSTLTSCTSEPIVSKNGVSGVALGEVGIQALLGKR